MKISENSLLFKQLYQEFIRIIYNVTNMIWYVKSCCCFANIDFIQEPTNKNKINKVVLVTNWMLNSIARITQLSFIVIARVRNLLIKINGLLTFVISLFKSCLDQNFLLLSKISDSLLVINFVIQKKNWFGLWKIHKRLF